MYYQITVPISNKYVFIREPHRIYLDEINENESMIPCYTITIKNMKSDNLSPARPLTHSYFGVTFRAQQAFSTKNFALLGIRLTALSVTASFRNRFIFFMGSRVSRSLIFTCQQSSPELQACFKFDPILAIFAAMHTFSVSFHAVVSLSSLEDLKLSFANIAYRMQTKSVRLVLHRTPLPSIATSCSTIDVVAAIRYNRIKI